MHTSATNCEMTLRPAKPVLKWAGGKTQLLDVIVAHMPKKFNRYFEPFIGSAAVLLNVVPEVAFINDINAQLINLYTNLQDSIENVIEIINALDAVPCKKERYYEIRRRYNDKIVSKELDAECAALMVWINKHCFNGLYRVNSKGLFNVPYNNRASVKSMDESNARAINEYFCRADVTITCMDFEEACKDVREGDFVYFDSPYVPASDTASFTDYTQYGFSLCDHERLAELVRKLDQTGVKVMVSNNDVPLVRSLYAGYEIIPLSVKRMINRDANNRTGNEVLIRNY